MPTIPILPTLPRLPAFTLPAAVAALTGRLPTSPASFALARALDLGVGRVVSVESVAALQGRCFALRVVDLAFEVRVESTASGFRVAPPTRTPDLSVGATLRDFIALGLREEDPDALFFSGRLTVEGDTALGLTVKNLLDGIDWSAWLPRVLRDALARR